MDNSAISRYELLGRNVTFPVSFNKNNKIKARRFYPYNREDSERPGYFTNKISLARLCKCYDAALYPTWSKHIEVAENFNRKSEAHGGTVKFIKGFLVVRALDFDDVIFSTVPAANMGNPYHMHILINDFDVPFSQVDSVGEILPEDVRYKLDMLQKKSIFVEVNADKRTAVEFQYPCGICDKV